MDRGNLADLTAFVAVADRLSFRAAASQLGVTPSALSHSMRQLEERLGVRLLHRTTRSVSLTDAGRRLLDRLRPAIDEIAGALEDLNQERQRPMGRLRIYAIHLAGAAVVAPIWGRFLSTYPEVHLELAVGEAPIDIVAKGFDAGIGPRDRVPADMIVVRVMGPMKIAVVGAPRAASPRSLFRATTTMRAPILASVCAATSPIPDVAPVMTTVLPFMLACTLDVGLHSRRFTLPGLPCRCIHRLSARRGHRLRYASCSA